MTQQKLYEFSQLYQNRLCADCLQSNPRWCNLTEGVIICNKCVGVHRQFGSGKCKSLDLDILTEAEFATLSRYGGNYSVNKTLQKYLRLYDRIHPDSSFEERTQFIMSKYKKRAFEVQPKEEKSKLEHRIAYYFITVDLGELKSSSLPAKKISEIRWIPRLKEHYPKKLVDGPDLSMLPQLTFPDDIQILTKNPGQEIRQFVQTNQTKESFYGVSLVFYELKKYNELVKLFKVAGLGKPPCNVKLYAPKAICLLSAWPFYKQFAKFLETVYRIQISEAPFPLERYISHFLYRVPVPPRGELTVQYSIAGQVLEFMRAPVNSLPYTHLQVNFWHLFRCLSINNLMTVWRAFVLEFKVVLVSRWQSLLVDCAHTLCSTLWPFKYCGSYIPVLPRDLLGLLDQPGFGIMGVHPDWLYEKDSIPSDCLVVYLDKDRIKYPRVRSQGLPGLPEKAGKKLMTNITKHLAGLDQIAKAASFAKFLPPTTFLKHLPPLAEVEYSGNIVSKEDKSTNFMFDKAAQEVIVDGFARFWVFNLQHHWEHEGVEQCFFIKDAVSNKHVFQLGEFLGTEIPKNNPIWFKRLTGTQMWSYFVQEREEYLDNPQHTSEVIRTKIHLFNEKILEKQNRGRMKTRFRATPLLSNDMKHIKTYACEQPSDSNLPAGKKYSYNFFPKLNPALFHPNDPIVPPWPIEPDDTKGRKVNQQMRDALGMLLSSQRESNIETITSYDVFKDALLEVQAHARKHVAQRRYQDALKVIRQLQARLDGRLKAFPVITGFHKRRNHALTLQAALRAYLKFENNSKREDVRLAIMIQGRVRARKAYEQFKTRRHFVIILQAAFRTASRNFKDLVFQNAIVNIAVRIQCLAAQSIFQMKLKLICAVQALCRGVLIRKQEQARITDGMKLCQERLRELWQSNFTLRSTRAQFLTIFQEPTYLNLAIHQEEVALLDTHSSGRDQGLALSRYRYEQEALEIKQVLRAFTTDQRNYLYEQVGVRTNSRRRKWQLLNLLWSESISLSDSTELTLRIMPQGSLNAVESKWQWQVRKSQRIQRVLTEFVQGAMLSMGTLHGRLETAENQAQMLISKLDTAEEEVRRIKDSRLRFKLSLFDSPKWTLVRDLSTLYESHVV